MEPQSVKIGIVGAGGGFRGAYVLGFLTGLLRFFARHKILVHYYGAVSVSAPMMARASEAHTPDDYEPILGQMAASWKKIEEEGPSSIFDFSYKNIHLWNAESILDNKPLVELAKNLNPQKSASSPATLDVFVFDNETKEHITISNRDADIASNPELLRDAVVASMSLIPIFSETKVGSRFCYDGGFISLRGAVEAGCDIIFALFPYPKRYKKPPAKNDFLNRHFPWLEKTASVSAAILRERDAFELRYWQDILAREAEIFALKKELAENLRDDENRGWLEKVVCKLPILGRLLEEKRPCRASYAPIPEIIPFYAENSPDALQLKDFNVASRDITVAIERGAKQIEKAEKELEKLLGLICNQHPR